MRKIILAIVIMFMLSVLLMGQQSGAQNNHPNIPMYRLLISFGNAGSGINVEGADKINKAISDFEKERNVKIEKKIIRRGENEEFDFGFVLAELSKEEQKNFIAKINSVTQKMEFVLVGENIGISENILMETEERTRYRLVISFVSICCGIDRDARNKVNKAIIDYEREKNVKLERETSSWGEEGEIDYGFMLSELSQEEQEKFITKIMSITEKVELVNVTENHTLHKANPRQYRLIISFGSECCGIDQKAEKEIGEIIAKYEKKNNVKLERKTVRWGKEGERDFCYLLGELSKGEQWRLIAEINAVAKKSKLVDVKENAFNTKEQ